MTRRISLHSLFKILFAVAALLASAPPLSAGEEKAVLNGLFGKSTVGTTRLTLDFNRLPTYELKTSGQRIDLFLHDSEAGAGLKHLPEDDKVIKVLVAKDVDTLVVSLLLRRLPSHVVATPNDELHQLDVVIRWDSETAVRPGIVFDLPDMPAVRRRGQEMRRTSLARSRFSNNWQSFLKTSHTPIRLNLEPRNNILLLDLGQSAGNAKDNLQTALKQKKWDEVIHLTDPVKTPEEGFARALALLHQGQFTQTLALLRQMRLSEQAKPKDPRFAYLQAHAEAGTGKPYVALLTLARLVTQTDHKSWKNRALLLQAEIELRLRHANKARTALEGIAAGSSDLLDDLATLRQADTLAVAGDCNAAMAAYRRLPEDLVATDPFSLAEQAYCSQMTGDMARSRALFNSLAAQLPEGEGRDLARYGELTCFTKPSSSMLYLDELERLRWDRKDGETAYRAMMKLADLMAPGTDEATVRHELKDYRLVAEKAPLVGLRLEAWIKTAIIKHLLKQDEEAIAILEKTLRNFSRGQLRGEALSLLGELLPPTIERLISEGRTLPALVLVERNRDLLIQQPLSWEFLYRVASAFDRLELDQRADKIYLYLYDRAKDPVRKARACLLLAQNDLQLGEWDLVEQFCERYRTLDPRGKDTGRSYLLQLKARVARDGRVKALDWLDQRQLPSDRKLALYAAGLYWREQRYDKVTDLLGKAYGKPEKLPLEAALWQAEGCYRLGRKDLALKYFRKLFDHPDAAAQARYRVASILLEKNGKSEAEELFRQVAGLKNEPRWSRLAEDRLQELNL